MLLAAVSPIVAQPYYWSAFAGLPPQFGSADGVGTAARFFLPSSLVATTTGFIFVCDSGNNTIRMISPNGAVTTYSGMPGSGGAADGAGTTAKYNFPTGITLADGFLYVADRGNHAIRLVGANGTVVTIAGRLGVPGSADGNGPNARFNSPSDIQADLAGNLYVADRENHVIRKIDLAGEVSTLAGAPGVSGSTDGLAHNARFFRPTGLYITPSGVVYVSDTYNHTIRRIGADGIVSTVAGSVGNIGAVNGTGSAARFRFPQGIVATSEGKVWVADQAHSVREISSAGVVTTFAGRLGIEGSSNGSKTDARFFVPSGVAYLNDGIAVADSFNHSIRKISFDADQVTTIAGSSGNFGREDGVGSAARFNYPSGVAVHSSGDIYVADTRGSSIRRISRDGTVVRIAGAMSGDLYLDGPAGANSLNAPHGIAVAPDRTVYFCERQRHTIRMIRPDGSVSTLAGSDGTPGSANGSGSNARFAFPAGIALDREGNLYIADSSTHTIRRIAAGTSTVTTFAGSALSAGSNDGTTGARFHFPQGIATDSQGNVYVADTANHLLRKITPAGEVSTLAGLALAQGTTNGSGAAARFSSPYAVAVSAAGTVYVADYGSDLIRQVSGETVSTIGGVASIGSFRDGTATASFFHQPTGIAVDATGNLFVTEGANSIVRRGELLTTPGISSQPRSLAVAPGSTATFSVTATGGALSYQWRFNGATIPGATSSTLSIPNAQSGITGNYTVTIVNPLGNITSQSAQLTISTASEAGRIVNLSILTSLPQSGDDFTMGFVVGGAGTSGAKTLLVRAAGPSLGALGVEGTLDDPKFERFFGAASQGGNDNWGGSLALATAMSGVGAFAYVGPSSLDAAAVGEFQLGNNSIKVSAAGTGTGTVIAEVYDATPTSDFTFTTPRLVNVSVLKHIGSGLTAGFTLGGLTSKTVLIRAVGPTLGNVPFNVGGAISDPQLSLFSKQTQIATNNDWGGTPALSAAFTQVGAFQLPAGSRDAALVTTLAPGNYTVEVTGVGGVAGVALIEVYEVP